MTDAPVTGSARWTGAEVDHGPLREPRPRGGPAPGGPRRGGLLEGGLVRVGLHLLLAALPLLAISAHVFGLVRMQLSAALLVVPLATAVIALSIFAPHGGDRVLAHGFLWGMIGTAIYDVFRLDTVYMLHWWADFIPTMGTWITGDPDGKVGGAIVGYLWRYPGDGGGIGITFFALASAVGLHQRSRAVVVGASVAFAVFPVWAGLIGTVALASNGQRLMFPLTPTTITLSLIGHLIFGLIMGLGFWRSRSVQEHWPWEPLVLAPSRGTALPAPPSGAFDTPPSRPLDVGRERTRTHSGPLPSVPLATGSTPASGSRPNPPRTSGSTSVPVLAPTAAPPAPGSTVPPPPVQPVQPVESVPAMPSPPVAAASADDRVAAAPAVMPRPRDRGTPPRGVARLDEPDTGGSTLDPHTFQLWQRQMDTTVRGRRTHRARR